MTPTQLLKGTRLKLDQAETAQTENKKTPPQLLEESRLKQNKMSHVATAPNSHRINLRRGNAGTANNKANDKVEPPS